MLGYYVTGWMYYLKLRKEILYLITKLSVFLISSYTSSSILDFDTFVSRTAQLIGILL